MISYISLKEDRISELNRLANEFLIDNNITIESRFLGVYDGKELFGIMTIKEGKEAWFDDGISDGMVCAWDNKQSVDNYIEGHVKPNLILGIEREKTKLFQIQLAEYQT